jgi:hypothetical protein
VEFQLPVWCGTTIPTSILGAARPPNFEHIQTPNIKIEIKIEIEIGGYRFKLLFGSNFKTRFRFRFRLRFRKKIRSKVELRQQHHERPETNSPQPSTLYGQYFLLTGIRG